ncbi:cytochrome P450 [Coprinopsis marcescibilis]|uniref:Cytochrome P450 n=1 Tax=Coprinopsis marcescibilis TaxID=230819 RepID=A0A5C3KJZ5_COPMA|nr:cytochrome P450 [Coprinopsis marcescibilis]
MLTSETLSSLAERCVEVWSNHTLLLLGVGTTLAILWIDNRKRQRQKLPLPPGPKGLPLIGNMLDIPSTCEWEKYHEWCKEFDTDVLYLNVAGTHMIVLDNLEVTTDLLEKRSTLYSSRAKFPMIRELMGWDFNFTFMDYGKHWQKYRRLVHQALHSTAARQFRPQLIKSTRNLLNSFLEKPESLIPNLRHMASETILDIAYGIEVLPTGDPYVDTAEQALHYLCAAAMPGAFLVDSIPILKYVPEWFLWPFTSNGGGFKKKAREWKVVVRRFAERPFNMVKKGIADGTAKPSFVSNGFAQMEAGVEDDAYQEDIIMGAAGTLYTGGTDTTVAALTACMLALVKNPEIVKKAQQQLDSVIQSGHLPDFHDEPLLPYITAIAKEALRWREVLPISVPHYINCEDEYKGYRIPAGSWVIPNAWRMLHNENVYPDPFKFIPERFLTKDGKLDLKTQPDPSHACWGFGRRICPGRFLAFEAMWVAIASILYVFDIEKKRDEAGNEIEPLEDFQSSLVVISNPFPYSIKPRSKEKEELIKNSALSGRCMAFEDTWAVIATMLYLFDISKKTK